MVVLAHTHTTIYKYKTEQPAAADLNCAQTQTHAHNGNRGMLKEYRERKKEKNKAAKEG